MDYYNHPNKDIAILKANLNDEYYPIEEILGGTAKELEEMYNEGLSKIRSMAFIYKNKKDFVEKGRRTKI